MPVKKQPQYLYHVPRIHDGLEFLLKNDPVFRRTGIGVTDIKRDYIGPGFAGLVRIVIGQQVSVAAADSLWTRFESGVPAVTPNSVLVLKPEDMRTLGLSHQKARYIGNLAQAVNDQSFDPAKLDRLDDEEVYEKIRALKGFGSWSAEMFLIFGLARPDVWPSGDLGIQEGLRLYLGEAERPDAVRTKAEGERFRPYRTAAALLLWQMKGMQKQ